MSLAWEHKVGDTHYQVRHAGRSVRLYTNGVLHSQYNPQRAATGSVWDLLWIPAFFLPPGQLGSVLVLGVGGGAAIQQLRTFMRPGQVTGIDCSEVHLSIARQFFGVQGPGVELVRADAAEWLSTCPHRFDLIIDDLFGDADGEPRRAVRVDSHWARLLTSRLHSKGVLVVNHATPGELAASALLGRPEFQRVFASAFRLSTPQNYNAVGVFCRQAVSTRTLRRRLYDEPALDPRKKASGLRYRIRTLKGQDR